MGGWAGVGVSESSVEGAFRVKIIEGKRKDSARIFIRAFITFGPSP